MPGCGTMAAGERGIPNANGLEGKRRRPGRRAFAVLLVAMQLLAVDARAQPSAPAPPTRVTGQSLPVLSPPVLLSDPFVEPPEEPHREVRVELVVVVNADGTVRSAVPVESDEPFSSQASRAAVLWRFTPARRGDQAIVARIHFEVFFHPKVMPSGENSRTAPAAAPSTAPARPAANLKSAAEVEEVTIRGAHGDPSRTASLSRAEVREIPGTFGDPFRAIEILPGVTPIISGLPFFFIRGAPPGDVGYFLDGVRVPYLFHVGAGPSVVHPGLIDTVDLYPGGYPARFGRFSGGIVSGETLAPRTDAAHGEYNLRLFDAGALVETPFADGRGTALVGGRYSYTALLLSLFAPNTALAYWDYQARLSYDLTPKDRVSVFGFGAYDYLGQKTASGTQTLFGTTFHRVDLRYDHKVGADGTLRAAVTGGLDYTDIGDGQSVRDRSGAARTELTYKVSRVATVRAGADLQVDRYDVVLNGELSPAQQSIANFFPSRTDFAGGTRADVLLQVGRRLEVTPGVRFDLFGSEGATAAGIDPRLSTRTVIADRVRLLSAFGLAHQAPAFVIPVPGLAPGGLSGGLQTAVQESAGFEFDLGQGTIATATVYNNGFYNMSDALSVTAPQVSGCPPGTFPGDSLAGDRGSQPTGSASCGPRFTQGTLGPDRSGGGGQAAQNSGDVSTANALEARSRGQAYGLEIYVKRKLTKRLGGILSYTLSRSTRTADNRDFIAAFDRTHVVNAAVAYDLGRNWRAGTRVTFYTGLPKTPEPTDPSTRLSPFFRLDLRLEKRWQLSKRWWISFVAEWLNATLSKEAVGTNCTLSGCTEVKIGPVTIPSLGVEGGF